MKKLFAVFGAMVFFAGVGFADLRVKAGLDIVGNVKAEAEGAGATVGNKMGFSVAADYMYPATDMIKVGGGVQYLFARDMNMFGDEEDFDLNFSSSYLPIFASVQLSPFAEESGLFFKGNLGYSIMYDSGMDLPSGADEKGGIYVGLGFGYEFEQGIFFDAMYGYYGSEVEFEGVSIKTNTSQVTLSIGYKFAI